MATKKKADNVATLVNELYDQRERAWAAALVTAQTFLETLADDVLEDLDRDRLNAQTARIKDRDRTADKIRRQVAEGKIKRPTTPDAIAESLHDLIGIKVLCKTPRDLAAFTEKLNEACTSPTCSVRLAVPPNDYVTHPKDSGYRAYHAILLVKVATHAGDLSVKVEVQVKTLLQDAWGELTHEDMYKPGKALKPNEFHRDVARKMAELLDSVDTMADLLAAELDRQTAELDAGPDGTPSNGSDEPTVYARITRTGPRYALAVGADGRQGLIPARSVRRVVGSSARINVNDYLEVGDTVDVRVEETDTALYYHPVAIG
ncbi:S1 RNA-binding domain-containing protein [Rhodococcus spelaei]|uniref:S1 RNA-binding domain-containing protein n=1 Tax=Rhodococcus spelaei TaxID=2546320 RepID=A0A541B0D7_9NOCA|nr:S1 RNA-binding domain-containing protein [Rhodococcus spelaei]TQF65776.1 S1 RNA-binding domain-containing protein [Rhodococcus spelaei]